MELLGEPRSPRGDPRLELRRACPGGRFGVVVGHRRERREAGLHLRQVLVPAREVEVAQAHLHRRDRARRPRATPGGSRRSARTSRCRAAGRATSSGTGSGREVADGTGAAQRFGQIHAGDTTGLQPGLRSIDSTRGTARMYDILIRGGDLVDGTGQRPPAGRRRHPGRPHGRDRRPSTDGGGRRRSTPPARWSRPASSTCTRTTTRRCSGTARSRRRRCTVSPPRSPATAASPSPRCPTTPPTATTSCACWRGSRACRSNRSATGVPWNWTIDRRVLRRDRGPARHQRRRSWSATPPSAAS